MYSQGMATKSARDPEGRRRAIVDAAAELIIEVGLNGVTHRKVAAKAGVPLGSTTAYFATLDDLLGEALVALSEETRAEFDALVDELETSTDVPRTLARDLTKYLSDPDRVRAESAFYIANLENPKLRPLVTQWHDGTVEYLSKYVDESAARAVAAYADGVVFGALRGTPPAEDEIATAIARLMGIN